MSEAEKPQLAVALRYEAPGAPKVVASGRGLVGERIIAAAQALTAGRPIRYLRALP